MLFKGSHSKSLYLHPQNHYPIYIMNKTYFLVLLLISILPVHLFSQQNKLTEKTAFNGQYPQFFHFRGEMKRDIHASYDTWEKTYATSSGLLRKYICEELKIDTVLYSWLNRFAEKHPEKLLLLHFNGEARQVNNYPEVSRKYFPGHWVYEAGSLLAEDCTASQTHIQVKTIDCFREKAYVYRNTSPKQWIPHYVLLVELDEQGNKLWYNSEIAHIKSIDSSTNTLILERGRTNTKSRSFKAGKTYIAPIAGGVWGNDVMLYYNLSSACPKDKDGRTAADILLNEIHDWFNPNNGVLKNLDGIAFDVNYFDVSKHESWDTDNDGQADGGWINGQNIWQIGDLQFLKDLRKQMNKDFIITSDGQHPINQQAVGILNGIESEGLVQHNDGWRGFSRVVNTHLYWDKFNPLSPQFRYVVLKLMDGNDQHHVERLQRFGVATATCLGAYTTVPNSYSSLPSWVHPCSFGRMQGELIRCAKSSSNLLPKTPAELLHKGNLKGENCLISTEGNSIIINPTTQSSVLSIENVELPTGDITIFIEAQTITSSDAASDHVPRFIHVSLSNLPDYETEKKTKEFFTDLYGLVGHEKNENSFYFRRPRTPVGKQTLTITIKGMEDIQIHSIKIYNHPDILIRQFEKAVVLVNPALEEQEVNLSDFIPQYSKKVRIAPIDAVFIPRSQNE